MLFRRYSNRQPIEPLNHSSQHSFTIIVSIHVNAASVFISITHWLRNWWFQQERPAAIFLPFIVCVNVYWIDESRKMWYVFICQMNNWNVYLFQLNIIYLLGWAIANHIFISFNEFHRPICTVRIGRIQFFVPFFICKTSEWSKRAWF